MEQPTVKFTATILDAGRGGAYVEVPVDIEEVFNKKRVKIIASIEGIPYRGSVVKMGGPKHIFPILKSIRVELKKNIGDLITISFTEDTEPRILKIPDDITEEFHKDSVLQENFLALSYTHQREYIRWVEEAKKTETRKARIGKLADLIQEKKRK